MTPTALTITPAAINLAAPDSFWVGSTRLSHIAQALAPALALLPDTDHHLALPALALALAATAPALPAPGQACPCGYTITPEDGDFSEAHELDYAVGQQDGTLSNASGYLTWDATTEPGNQHTVALECPHCSRLYSAIGLDRSYS